MWFTVFVFVCNIIGVTTHRIPINIDATPNKGTVDMFWTYQRQFTVDVTLGEFQMKGRTPEEDPETHAQVQCYSAQYPVQCTV
eukprot:9484921-Pyramimonas_sp.AAC.1